MRSNVKSRAEEVKDSRAGDRVVRGASGCPVEGETAGVKLELDEGIEEDQGDDATGDPAEGKAGGQRGGGVVVVVAGVGVGVVVHGRMGVDVDVERAGALMPGCW